MFHTEVPPVSGKRGVIITGAARRLGRAAAILLAAKYGYDVVAHYNASHGDALCLQKIIQETYGRRCLLFRSDLRDFASLKRLVQHSFSEMPHCTMLINNASVFYNSSLKESGLDAFEENYNLHLRAPIFLTQYFAQMCPGRGEILNVIDSSINRNGTKYFFYLLSKKSLADFTTLAATELAPTIRVNAVCPSRIPDHEIDNIQSIEDIEKAPYIMSFLRLLESLVSTNSTCSGKFLFMDPRKT